jgi:hypothetical protein
MPLERYMLLLYARAMPDMRAADALSAGALL